MLKDPDVAVVALSGFAGTGKTILALAAGLDQVMEPGPGGRPLYDKLAIYRPVVAVGNAETKLLTSLFSSSPPSWRSTTSGRTRGEARLMAGGRGRLGRAGTTCPRGA